VLQQIATWYHVQQTEIINFNTR